MLDANTTANVFRFTQHRPPRMVDPEDTLPLVDGTPMVMSLGEKTGQEKVDAANNFLDDPPKSFEEIAGEPFAVLAKSVAKEVLADEGSLRDFRLKFAERAKGEGLSDPGRRIREDIVILSDMILAAKQASTGPRHEANRLLPLYRAYHALDATFDDKALASPLERHLRRPVVMPATLLPTVRPAPQNGYGKLGESEGIAEIEESPTVRAERVSRALAEVSALDRPEFMHIPEEGKVRRGAKEPAPFALTERGLARLSVATLAVLREFDIDPRERPINAVIDSLESEVEALAIMATEPQGVNVMMPEDIGIASMGTANLQPAGVADLLVVKQHLKAYRRLDVAHVENVMIGETKSRTHRMLERTEETFITEQETVQESETELETADRFEMNRETSRTIERDQMFGFGLSLSGKYGPTVEFSSSAEAEISTSTEESERSATTYAKDIVERSLERVTERVREEQIRRLVREEEETNLHELKNETGNHVSGVYQFLEKIYESQVFNYGIRQIFDFMIPEPASYIWHVEDSPDADLNLPAPPPPLETFLSSAAAVTPGNYLAGAAEYGATGIEPPPPTYKTASVSMKHGENNGEGGQPRSVTDKEVAVPTGYRPYRAYVRPLALTDDDLTLGVTVGHAQRVWSPVAGQITGVGSGHDLTSTSLVMGLTSDSYSYEEQSKLSVHVVAFETNTYSVVVDVIFRRTSEAFRVWQIKTFEAIANAYQDALLKYEQKVEELKAQAETEAARNVFQFGAPPSQNLKTIKNELKKHCISIVTRQRYDAFDATQDADPPFFDFDAAALQGDFIRFFEQAFEWDQMQYVFYPYFWGRKDVWMQRFLRQDVDPNFLEFLQAGEARVVVPVRPGFEVAVTHYLETGNIWNGAGDPPDINSPLYVPIIEEIKERTGAPQSEIAVGDPWDTILPTPLVILRHEQDLPKWERQDEDGWDWEEVANE